MTVPRTDTSAPPDQTWLRVLLPLASAVLVATGFASWSTPLVYDPLVPRLLLAAMGVGLVLLSFHPRLRSELERGAWLWGLLCTLWFQWVGYQHDLSVDDVIGLLVLVSLTGVFCRTGLQVALLVGAVLLGFAGYSTLKQPDFSPALATMLLALAGGVLGMMSVSRIRLLASLEQRVDDRTRALSSSLSQLRAEVRERELAELNAERASQAKTRFLQTMSHELRTPLTTVLGYTEIIAEELEELEGSPCQEDLAKVEGATKHLLALIDQMLDLTRVESESIGSTAVSVPIADVVDEAIAVSRTPRTELDIPEHLQAVGDRVALRQVLINLLDNARKFSHEGTPIRVRAEASGPSVRIEVIDQGPGIPEAERQRIFERFVQLDGSTTRIHGGTGLGLTVARELTRAMGGRIEVESTQGGGATFRVLLPVADPR